MSGTGIKLRTTVTSCLHMKDWTSAFQKYQTSIEAWQENPWEKIASVVSKGQTPIELYAITFFLRHNKTFNEFFWNQIRQRSLAEKNERLNAYLELKPESRYYHVMLALDLLIGHWSSEADDLHSEGIVRESFLPSFRSYVFDLHTFIGKKRLLSHWHLVAPKKDHTKVGLDLRWSGSLLGCLYRSEAFNKFGTMRSSESSDIPWIAVDMGDDLWKPTINLDKFFYAELFEAIDQKTKK